MQSNLDVADNSEARRVMCIKVLGSWPWLFYINLPVGILAVTLAIFLLPAEEAATQKRPFDLLGFLLISPGMVSLLYGFDQINQPRGIFFLVLGALMMAAFAWDASKKKALALIDLRLFKNPIFRTAVIVQFLANGVMYAGQMLVPLYLIVGCGFSATTAGWLLAPMGVGMIVISPMMGYLTDRFGSRRVSVAGVVLNTLGTLPFLWMIHAQYSDGLMFFCMIARGVGQGATGLPSMAAGYASVEKSQIGLATTAMNVVQRLGGPVATTIIALVIAMTTTHSGFPNPAEFMIPFLVLITIQLLVFVAAMGLPTWIHQDRAPLSERKIS